MFSGRIIFWAESPAICAAGAGIAKKAGCSLGLLLRTAEPAILFSTNDAVAVGQIQRSARRNEAVEVHHRAMISKESAAVEVHIARGTTRWSLALMSLGTLETSRWSW
jgi:hypothetical protein